MLAEIPKENVNRHVVEDTAVNAVLRRLLRAGGRFGHRFPVPLRLAARGPLLTVLHRKRGARPVTTPAGAGRAAAAVRRRTSRCCRTSPASGYDDWLSVDRHATATG